MTADFVDLLGKLDKAVTLVDTKKDILTKAEAARDKAKAEYEVAVSEANDVRAKVDERLNVMLPSSVIQGRIRGNQ